MEGEEGGAAAPSGSLVIAMDTGNHDGPVMAAGEVLSGPFSVPFHFNKK